MTDFVTFGCWNNRGINLENVIANLKLFVTENRINFLSITGDNYYGKKDGKKKIFNIEDFTHGYSLLNDIDIPKYFIMGNHDIKDYASCDPIVKLEPIKKEIDFFYSQLMFERSHYFIIYENTINIFLDSTIYELPDDIPIEETCYKNLFPDNSKLEITTIGELKEYQLNMTLEILKLSIGKLENVLFHFHHPIFSIKSKSDKNMTKVDITDGLITFYKNLEEILKGKNIFHICSDTHFYENGILEIDNLKINQYIVGTGGTSLDDTYNSEFCNSVFKLNNIKYTILESIQNHGFLHVSWNPGKLTFNFVPVRRLEEGTERKYLEKYLKYKSKYLNLKKNISF